MVRDVSKHRNASFFRILYCLIPEVELLGTAPQTTRRHIPDEPNPWMAVTEQFYGRVSPSATLDVRLLCGNVRREHTPFIIWLSTVLGNSFCPLMSDLRSLKRQKRQIISNYAK